MLKFFKGLTKVIAGKKQIDADLFEEIETQLLMADVGVEATDQIIADLTDKLARKQLQNEQAVKDSLKQDLVAILEPCQQTLDFNTNNGPFVLLVIGINGAGKTTTIGKLTKQLQSQGKSVMLAAGDTYRAAAIEQLQHWGEQNNVPVIAQQQGSDSASVIFDAIESAKAKNIDVLIADTAGRLHTQSNLMEELKKVKRVIQKCDANAPHETLLVLDSGTGQNGIIQAQQFNEALGLSGIALTKLDGTAKGGVIFAIAKTLALPIRFIGVGEAIDDLKPFNAQQFVENLL